MAVKAANFLKFLNLIGKLKNIKRTGWVLRNVEDPETVAGHMYRMGVMAMMIPEASGLDKDKCLRLALVHDIAECIVGDITPHCGVPVAEKHQRESEAMKVLSSLVGEMGPNLSDIYQEYAEQTTAEAQMVKELDRLDMVVQAFEYEEQEESPGRLEEFFESTKDKFKHPWTLEILQALYTKRSLHIQDKKKGDILSSNGSMSH